MRKTLSIAAIAIFVLGLIWQVGRWLLRWSGHSLGLRSLPDHQDFVEGLAAKITSGDASIGWIIGPWLLMSIGLMALVVLRSRTAK